MQKLLTKDMNKRLGNNDGYREVLSHEWFADFDFQQLLEKKVPKDVIPFVPESDYSLNELAQFFNISENPDELRNSSIEEKYTDWVKSHNEQFDDKFKDEKGANANQKSVHTN